MTDLSETCRALPVFPLPGVVLLPGELLPLRVFEPRYRALVAHVLAADGVLGIATIAPGHEAEHLGAPPLCVEVGVGHLDHHEPLSDGRSDILVRFESAGRIVRELEGDEPFRRVEVALRGEPTPDYPPSQALRVLGAQAWAAVGLLRARAVPHLEGRAWVDAMARLFLRDPTARRAYLDADAGGVRLDLLESALLDVLAQGAPSRGDA
ncbi:MAG: LON peptidase substrate-binding domain-containing protein [Alphaproteobacteria bacterium]|nr:LON peptidase substrate-binding domain-containing protein [Alphaproteobacteria bacterium]